MDKILAILSFVTLIILSVDMIYISVAYIRRENFSKIQTIFSAVIFIMFLILTAINIVSGEKLESIGIFVLNTVLWALNFIKGIVDLKKQKRNFDNHSEVKLTSKDTKRVDLTKK